MRFHRGAHGVHAVCARQSSRCDPASASDENAPTGGGAQASVGVTTTSTSGQARSMSPGSTRRDAAASSISAAARARPCSLRQPGSGPSGAGRPAHRAAMMREKTANRSTGYGAATGTTPLTCGWFTSNAADAVVAVAIRGSTAVGPACPGSPWKGTVDMPRRRPGRTGVV